MSEGSGTVHEKSGGGAPNIVLVESGTDALQPHADRIRPLAEFTVEMMHEYAVRWERLRRVSRNPWLMNQFGLILIGASLGALVAGESLGGRWVLVSLLVGLALLLGAFVSRRQQRETIHGLCSDFMHFIDRWPCGEPEYKKNSDYARARVDREDADRMAMRVWRLIKKS